MSKANMTDPEDLQEQPVPEGTYPCTIISCLDKPGNWGEDHQNIQRFSWRFQIDEADPEFVGRNLFDMTPIAKGLGGRFLNYCQALGVTPTDFDSDDVAGQQIALTLTIGEDKRNGGLRNNIKAVGPISNV